MSDEGSASEMPFSSAQGDEGLEGRHDQRDKELPPVADNRYLLDEWMGFKVVLDHRGRDIFTAGCDDDVLFPVGYLRYPSSSNGPDVAGLEPALLIKNLFRGVGSVVIAFHHTCGPFIRISPSSAILHCVSRNDGGRRVSILMGMIQW